MILKKISEGRVSVDTPELVKEIKEKDTTLRDLRDETISSIITIYKKERPRRAGWKVSADDIISWFHESNTFADFVFFYAEDLSTYSISDFAEHDKKLANAIRKVLRNAHIINDKDEDISLSYDKEENPKRRVLSIKKMCTILFDELSKKAVRKFNDVRYVKPELLTDETTPDPAKFAANMEEVEDAYNSLSEDVEVCEKCGKAPCICEAAEKAEEEAEIKDETVPEEPEAESEKAVSPEITESVFSDIINSAIQKQWEVIAGLNSIIATIDFEYTGENKEDILSILNQLVDDNTIDVGMLHKISELISVKTTSLINAGQEKAEEIIVGSEAPSEEE